MSEDYFFNLIFFDICVKLRHLPIGQKKDSFRHLLSCLVYLKKTLLFGFQVLHVNDMCERNATDGAEICDWTPMWILVHFRSYAERWREAMSTDNSQ